MNRVRHFSQGNSLRRLLVLGGLLTSSIASAGSAPPQVAAHRGSVSQAPENTLAAFRWAETVGADVIEADLRVTADGHLVVIHDKRVNRTTDGRGRVREMDLAELKRLDAGRGQTIPTLDEVLGFFTNSNARLLLDVKDSSRVDPRLLVANLDQHGVSERVLVGGRTVELIRSLKTIKPDLQVLAMVAEPDEIEDYLALDVDGVRLWARWARKDPALAARIRASGAEVWVMAGGLKGTGLKKVLRLADGVITNHPAEARSLSLAYR